MSRIKYLLLMFLIMSACKDKTPDMDVFLKSAISLSTFEFSNQSDSTYSFRLSAYFIDNPDDFSVIINGEDLQSYSLQPTNISKTTEFISPSKNFELSIKYNGMQNVLTGALLDEIKTQDVEINAIDNSIFFSWDPQHLAKYYSVYIYDLQVSDGILDTLWVLDAPFLSISKNIFPDTTRAYGLFVASINAPFPNTNFYNMEGDIPGNFINYSTAFKRLTFGDSSSENIVIDPKTIQKRFIEKLFSTD